MNPIHVLLVLAGLPLLAWPFVLVAALFWCVSLGNIVAFSPRTVALIFLAGSAQLLALTYPLIYAVCARKALRAGRRGDAGAAWALTLRPFCALAATALLFLLWWLCDRAHAMPHR
ncbi:MAG: hypothetical protein KF715_01790 [Candidatus Didemnitutus sp.]|nr:hypothetical protein [Candidatus Didemnitutus sp.]